MESNRYNWREAFTFTRSEHRGFLALTCILVFIVVGRIVYFRWVQPAVVPFSIPTGWQSTVILPPDSGADHHRFTRNHSSAGSRSRYRSDTLLPREYSPVFRRSRMVELNAADTFELRALPAIGPFLARKIVEYRERLGGYFSTDQLLEVYRLTPGKLDTIRPYLVIDTSLVRRIDMNAVSLDALLKHPYLSRSQARGLLAYREKHGPFSQLADLKKCLLIDEITFEKIRDYVEVR